MISFKSTENEEKSALSSSSSSSSTSEQSESSSDSDTSSDEAVEEEEKQKNEGLTESEKAQFSVTSSDSAGLRMKIAFPRNQPPLPCSSDTKINNNNAEKKRLPTKKLIPQNNIHNENDKSGSDSDSSCCTNVS